MTNTPVLLALLGFFLHLTISTSSETCTLDTTSPSQSLIWCPCYEEFQCARLDVPLDYQDASLGRASVPIVKYPAQSINSSYGQYKGMVLLNPGGPGASGVNEALLNASIIQAVIGTNWDIAGFDIRGTWYSIPLANCSQNTSVSEATLRSRSVPRLTDDYFNGLIEDGNERGEQCATTIGGEKDIGPHMSTATIARDMLSIVNAFAETEDGARASEPSDLLHYYGISYGTFLGQTFASMFPDRVGNVVLDGIVSTEGYLSNFSSNSLNHIDGIVASFFIYCHAAGPSACPYYTGSTARDIYERFNQSFVQLDPRKAEAENWSNATDIEAALLILKIGLLAAADQPLSYFRLLPQVLLDLESALSTQTIGNWTEQADTIFADPSTTAGQLPEWSLGALCSDQNNTWYNSTLQDWTPLIEQIEQQSIIGEIWIKTELGCSGWSIKATEIFTGPFGGDTETPILFISNTYDPVTPIENGLSSVLKYKNAQLLTIDGMGHTTSATENSCGYAHVNAYFQTGKLPGNDSYCPLEAGPFGIVLNGTLKDNINLAGLSDLID